MCSTSLGAYEMAMQMAREYEEQQAAQKGANPKPEVPGVPESKADGPSRVVSDIDYRKFEQLSRDLDKEAKEEEFQAKADDAKSWCPLDHEHGPNCVRPRPTCSHDHAKERAIYEKSTDEKIAGADRFREEGNDAYRKGNYGLASVFYRKALLQFDYTFADTDKEKKWMEKVKLSCHNNLAACKVQLEDWEEAANQCRLALEIDANNVKAYYRRGLSFLALDRLDEAKAELMMAYHIEPSNTEVLRGLDMYKKKREEYHRRKKEVFGAMVKGDGNVVEPTDNEEAGEGASAASKCAQAAVARAAAIVDEVKQAAASANELSGGPDLAGREGLRSLEPQSPVTSFEKADGLRQRTISESVTGVAKDRSARGSVDQQPKPGAPKRKKKAGGTDFSLQLLLIVAVFVGCVAVVLGVYIVFHL
mmetsp:Transcript_13114/g.29123  ORF Transcript_13114/g.29123 Transcript_13114/m.29123 type:complete len:419 (+) Transcript_13114:41-1297(+)|eukprot:CAMPEP_0204320712 /NCGR_PEP_ID=MMETSP0469-20131031/7782_1 /ASSEMBLY_ACC=CAM_ASM_000384 /TAXON_ID=2969 /ORGANISM="Oxyrrhis marina" /LENGTH=418 /DNA_ID=CAMNT_0051301977 /DNA_START=26 /DNA_END=1282 /DNA_ORIENTATION=-